MPFRPSLPPRVVLALALAVFGALPCPVRAAHVERARWLMGTTCTLEADGPDSLALARAAAAALDRIAALEAVATRWHPSELTRLDGATAPTPLSPDLAAMIAPALDASRSTGGAFDPTVEPLTRAWDLRGRGRVPSAHALAVACGRVGWTHVRLDRARGTLAFTRRGMAIDLGGIAKGFALDRAAAVLRAGGATRARLNFGGELRTLGAGWSVAVANPAARLKPAVWLEVGDGAVSTSAQSERGFVRRGLRYGHVLDPRTGRPIRTRASVTVLARDGTRADALSTALLVMGRVRAALFARAHPDVGVLWLEPGARALRAWRWHVPAPRVAPGTALTWMIDTPHADGERTSR